MRTTRCSIVIALALFVGAEGNHAAAQSRALTPSEIEEAIASGIAREPEAYVMPFAHPGARGLDSDAGGRCAAANGIVFPGCLIIVAATALGMPIYAAIGGAALLLFWEDGTPANAVPGET